MTALALLLLPTATFASEVEIDWTGHITSYSSVGSGFPSALSTDAISGTLTYDTSLLPAPDATGVVSLTGGDFIGSTVLWDGGVFQPDALGGTGTDTLVVDPTVPEFTVLDSMFDPTGTHGTLLGFDVVGLPGLLTTGLGTGSLSADGSSFLGTGSLLDFQLTGGDGFEGSYVIDHLQVSQVSVPEPGTLALLATSLIFLAGTQLRRRLAVARCS